MRVKLLIIGHLGGGAKLWLVGQQRDRSPHVAVPSSNKTSLKAHFPFGHHGNGHTKLNLEKGQHLAKVSVGFCPGIHLPPGSPDGDEAP